MIKERVKFKKTLFKRRVDVFTNSTEDYDEFYSKLDLDILFFANPNLEDSEKNLKEVFSLAILKPERHYIYDDTKNNVFFTIDIFELNDITYREYLKNDNMFCYRFNDEPENIFIIEVNYEF